MKYFKWSIFNSITGSLFILVFSCESKPNDQISSSNSNYHDSIEIQEFQNVTDYKFRNKNLLISALDSCYLDSIGSLKFDTNFDLLNYMFFERIKHKMPPTWFTNDTLWEISRKYRAYYPLVQIENSISHIHNNVDIVEINFHSQKISLGFEDWVKNLIIDSKSHFYVMKLENNNYLILKQVGFLQYQKMISILDSCLLNHLNAERISEF
jgi:hypothetical protein